MLDCCAWWCCCMVHVLHDIVCPSTPHHSETPCRHQLEQANYFYLYRLRKVENNIEKNDPLQAPTSPSRPRSKIKAQFASPAPSSPKRELRRREEPLARVRKHRSFGGLTSSSFPCQQGRSPCQSNSSGTDPVHGHPC